MLVSMRDFDANESRTRECRFQLVDFCITIDIPPIDPQRRKSIIAIARIRQTFCNELVRGHADGSRRINGKKPSAPNARIVELRKNAFWTDGISGRRFRIDAKWKRKTGSEKFTRIFRYVIPIARMEVHIDDG